MLLKGINYTTYEVQDQLINVGKEGGEGKIHLVTNKPGFVAKIFHSDKADYQRENKLKVMLSSPPDRVIKQQLSWPEDILYDQNGKFVGYIMPQITNYVGLNKVLELNGEIGKQFTLKDRIEIAKNLCIAVNAFHKTGNVIGDFNSNNVAVFKEGTNRNKVILLDTDSYHIRDKRTGRTYKCIVGSPFFVSPEIQQRMGHGIEYADLTLPSFTKDSDNFALAIHIFQLLMNNFHPFLKGISSNAPSYVTMPDIHEEIIKRKSVYFTPDPNHTIPILSFEINVLPVELRELLKHGLIGDYKGRPTANDYWKVLNDYGRKLVQCKKDSSHYYYYGLSSCPVCDLRKKVIEKNQRIKANKSNVTTTTQVTNTQPTKTSFTNPTPVIKPQVTNTTSTNPQVATASSQGNRTTTVTPTNSYSYSFGSGTIYFGLLIAFITSWFVYRVLIPYTGISLPWFLEGFTWFISIGFFLVLYFIFMAGSEMNLKSEPTFVNALGAILSSLVFSTGWTIVGVWLVSLLFSNFGYFLGALLISFIGFIVFIGLVYDE